MGLLDRLRHELVDIVEWVDDTRTTLVWRFPRYRNQIKQGAKLIVRPGQCAIFVHQGKLADVFGPGTHELSTGNLPILGTLQGWKHGFDSPIKCEVYFVTTRQITELKWGTPNPVIMRDADFGPVRVRAFGTYALQATEPATLLQELVGTDGSFDTDEIGELMRSIITTAFADVLGEAEIPVLDLPARYRELSMQLQQAVQERIDDEYGLSVPAMFIVNVSLPEQVEAAIDARSSMGAIGDLDAYQQYQLANAMQAAANNPAGGGAAEGLGLGMGFAMANQMVNGGRGAMPAAPAAGGMMPPPPPAAPAWFLAVDGATTGPMTAADLANAIAAGQVTRDTMVWTQGMAGWAPAGSVPALAARFGATPPPPPPAPAG